MYIRVMDRVILPQIQKELESKSSQIVLILGMRQTGKTTLAKTVVANKNHTFFNFDLAGDRAEFLDQDRHRLGFFAKRNKDKIIVIDEVQKLPESTNVIKHLYDQYHLKFILTGSSELKMQQRLGDSLAGRLRIFRLYPLSFTEISQQSRKELDYEFGQELLFRALIFGSLPQIANLKPERYTSYLSDFTDQLLAKDVLEYSQIRKPTQIYSLAKLLAQQIGQLVNFNELSLMLEISRASVYNYLDVLEKLSIIVRASPISANEREAIGKKCKIYFTDLGIRNALLGNFDSFNLRTDRGYLLENAVFMGIKRKFDYTDGPYQIGFFRSPQGSEIDIVVKKGNKEYLYEVKASQRRLKQKKGTTFVTLENAQEFLF